MKKKRALWRLLALLGSILAVAAIIFLYQMIDWGVQETVDRDDYTWGVFHPWGGSYKSDPLESISFTKENNPELSVSTLGYFFGDELYLFFCEPDTADELIVSFSAQSPIYINGQQILSDVSSIALNDVSSLQCGERTYNVHLRKTSLPTLEINTTDGEVPYYNGGNKGAVMNLYDAEGRLIANDVVLTRVRGNTTGANTSKVPLRIESSKRLSLLGLKTAESWSLLANQFDPSFLRNQVAFDLASVLNLDYSPQQRFVDLYLNGKYFGIYTIATDVGLNPGSVDIPVISPMVPNGSYMVELDIRASDEIEDYKADAADPILITKQGVPVVLDSPSGLDSQTLTRVCEEIQLLEDHICAPNGMLNGKHFSEVIDLESFASFFLIQELMMNPDAAFPLSVFLYKDVDGIFCMGPVWDFDLTLGLAYHVVEMNEILLSDAWWWPYLLQDPVFVKEVQRQFEQLQPWYEQTESYLAGWEKMLQQSAANNYVVAYTGASQDKLDPEASDFSKQVQSLHRTMQERYQSIKVLIAALDEE